MHPVVPGRSDGDNECCLSWHIKGCCFDNCRKKYNHITLPNDAKEEMYKYVCAMHLCSSGRHQPKRRVIAGPVSSLPTLFPQFSAINDPSKSKIDNHLEDPIKTEDPSDSEDQIRDLSEVNVSDASPVVIQRPSPCTKLSAAASPFVMQSAAQPSAIPAA